MKTAINRVTTEKEDELYNLDLIKSEKYPWGDICPSCSRPHLYTYTNGERLCHKCLHFEERISNSEMEKA